MSHDLSFDLEEERRGVTARMKTMMESIIAKYGNIGPEVGDYFDMGNMQICEDRGQLRDAEVSHFGFLEGNAPVPHDLADGNGVEEDDDDDAQPSFGEKMLRDFGARMEQSMDCNMTWEVGEDGKGRWVLHDDVEEDILTTIGDSDSDRDISGEDEWSESGVENDTDGQPRVEQGEKSDKDQRSSASFVESEEESSGENNTDRPARVEHVKKSDKDSRSSVSFVESEEESGDENSASRPARVEPVKTSYKDHRSSFHYVESEEESRDENNTAHVEPVRKSYNDRRSSARFVESEEESGDENNTSRVEPVRESYKDRRNSGRFVESEEGSGGESNAARHARFEPTKKSSTSLVESEEDSFESGYGNNTVRPTPAGQNKGRNKHSSSSDGSMGNGDECSESEDENNVDRNRPSSHQQNKESGQESSSSAGSVGRGEESSESEDENDAERNRPSSHQQNKESGQDSSGSAGMGESEDELSDSSGISYRERQKRPTVTKGRDQHQKRDGGHEEKTLLFHKSKASLEVHTKASKCSSSNRKSGDKHSISKEEPITSPLFPEDHKKTSSKSVSSLHKDQRDKYDSFRKVIKAKKQAPCTLNADRNSFKKSKLLQSPICSTRDLKKEKHRRSSKKGQSHENVCMMEIEDPEVSLSSESESKKGCLELKSPYRSSKSEGHRKKQKFVIDLLEEPDEQTEVEIVSTVKSTHLHRSFNKPEKTDQGDSRKKAFSVPAKSRTKACTKLPRDVKNDSLGSFSEASNKVDLPDHKALVNYLKLWEPDIEQKKMLPRKKQVSTSKNMHHTSTTIQSVEETGGGHKSKSAVVGRKLMVQQDKGEGLQVMSSEENGSEAIGMNAVSCRPSKKTSKLSAEPIRKKLLHDQGDSSHDDSRGSGYSSFSCVSDGDRLDQTEGKSTQHTRSVKELQNGKKTRRQETIDSEVEEEREDSEPNAYHLMSLPCSAPTIRLPTEPSHNSTSSAANMLVQHRAPVEGSEESMNDEAAQHSPAYSMDENCSSKSVLSMDTEDPESSDSHSHQHRDVNSSKHTDKQLSSARSDSAQNSEFPKPSQKTARTPHVPLTPILKQTGQKSATPCGEKKRVRFPPTDTQQQSTDDDDEQSYFDDDEQSIVGYMQSQKSRLQQLKSCHVDSESDLSSSQCQQKEQERQLTSYNESLKEPQASLLSCLLGDTQSPSKCDTIQTSTPKRSTDKSARTGVSTPKGRKILQKDEVPSPCTHVRNQLENIRLGSPIQKTASSKRHNFDQSLEHMEVDESAKIPPGQWTRQPVSTAQVKSHYKLRERRAKESQILKVNPSNSSTSDVSLFSPSSASGGEKCELTDPVVQTPRKSGRLDSLKSVTTPRTDPRHNKRGRGNRYPSARARLNRSEVVLGKGEVKVKEEEEGSLRSSNQTRCSYSLRERRTTISSPEDQEVKNSPRKRHYRQLMEYMVDNGRLTKKKGQLSGSDVRSKKDQKDKLLSAASPAKQSSRPKKETSRWRRRRASFSSEAETTDSTHQSSSPEKITRRQRSADTSNRVVTRSQRSPGIDLRDRKVTRSQRSAEPGNKEKKVTSRQRSSSTAGRSPVRDVRPKELPAGKTAQWKRTPSKSTRAASRLERSPTYEWY